MNFKTILMALAMGSLAVGGIGCGGSDCEAAADRLLAKYEECGVTTTDGSTEDGGDAECSEAAGTQALCVADCVEAAPCDVLTGESTDVDALTAYGDCVLACA